MIKLAFKSLKTRLVIALLFILSVTSTISITMLSVNITQQIQEGLYAVDKKYDVVVGTKGSASQLILSSLFFSENPLGLVDTHYLDELKSKYEFAKIVPVAMADSYRGSAMIGSTQDLLEGYQLKEGKLFEDKYQVVLGYNVAQSGNLKVGDTITTSHGTGASADGHKNSPYTVVGVLAKTNTAYDNTCFTTYQSIWDAHEHEEEHGEELEHDEHADEHEEESHEGHEHGLGFSSILIKTGSIATLNKMVTDYKDDLHIQVVNTTKELRNLSNSVDMSKQISLVLCTIIIILSVILTIITSLMLVNHINNDVKTLRFLKAYDYEVFIFTLTQLVTLFVVSFVVSLVLRHYVLVLSNNISSQLGVVIDTSKFYTKELYVSLSYTVLVLASSLMCLKKEK